MLNNFCFHVYAQKSLSHSLTLSISHSLTLNMLNNFCFHVYAEKSLSHYHTLSLSHSLTLSLSHSHTLSVSHSWHAEQLLFSCLCSKVAVYRWKCQWFFWTSTATASPSPVTFEFIELVPSFCLTFRHFLNHATCLKNYDVISNWKFLPHRSPYNLQVDPDIKLKILWMYGNIISTYIENQQSVLGIFLHISFIGRPMYCLKKTTIN